MLNFVGRQLRSKVGTVNTGRVLLNLPRANYLLRFNSRKNICTSSIAKQRKLWKKKNFSLKHLQKVRHSSSVAITASSSVKTFASISICGLGVGCAAYQAYHLANCEGTTQEENLITDEMEEKNAYTTKLSETSSDNETEEEKEVLAASAAEGKPTWLQYLISAVIDGYAWYMVGFVVDMVFLNLLFGMSIKQAKEEAETHMSTVVTDDPVPDPEEGKKIKFLVRAHILYPLLPFCYGLRYLVTTIVEYFLLHSDIFKMPGTTLGMFVAGIKPDSSFAQREKSVADYMDLYAPINSLVTSVLFAHAGNALLFHTFFGYTPSSFMQRSGIYARNYYVALERTFFQYFRLLGIAYPMPFEKSTSFFERFITYQHLTTGEKFYKGKTLF